MIIVHNGSIVGVTAAWFLARSLGLDDGAVSFDEGAEDDAYYLPPADTVCIELPIQPLAPSPGSWLFAGAGAVRRGLADPFVWLAAGASDIESTSPGRHVLLELDDGLSARVDARRSVIDLTVAHGRRLKGLSVLPLPRLVLAVADFDRTGTVRGCRHPYSAPLMRHIADNWNAPKHRTMAEWDALAENVEAKDG